MLFNCAHIPGPPLTRYVERLWIVRGRLSSRWRNLIFPDGAMEMIFNLSDPQKLCARNNHERHSVFKRNWICGQRTEPIVIEEYGEINLVGVRFKPGGAYPFFHFPISELTGHVTELEDIWGAQISELREKLATRAAPKTIFAQLEQWLRQQLPAHIAGGAGNRSVAFALEELGKGGGGPRIGYIVEQTGVSHKHLIREFDRWVGLTPKLLARLHAFQAAVAWIGFKPAVDWADAAIACGYFHQAHFIREFRGFSGLTPEAYLSRRGPFLNYLEVQ
jgi:AraC-like DNA-binding protein